MLGLSRRQTGNATNMASPSPEKPLIVRCCTACCQKALLSETSLHNASRVERRGRFGVQPKGIYAASSLRSRSATKMPNDGVVCIQNTGSFEGGLSRAVPYWIDIRSSTLEVVI